MASSRDFFVKRKPPAELKHGILRRYPPILAGMTGKRGNEVVFLDGYAGPGMYDNDVPGSPLLLAEMAKGMDNRAIEGIFVERDVAHCRQLRITLEPYKAAMPHAIYQADVGDVVDQILARCTGKVLFAYLDPFGPAIHKDRVVSILNRNGTGFRAWPPTEMLLHFSASSIWREGSRALRREDTAALERFDAFLGGDWWQPMLADAGQETAGLAAWNIGERYAATLAEDTGCTAIPMPVFRSLSARVPMYVLILFTRHEEGVWKFASVLGQAQKDWRRACEQHGIEQDDERQRDRGQEGLFGTEQVYSFDEKRYEADLVTTFVPAIEKNLLGMLASGPVRIADRTLEVYGATLGHAWDKHVRAAVKNLHKQGLIDDDGKNDFHRRPIRRR